MTIASEATTRSHRNNRQHPLLRPMVVIPAIAVGLFGLMAIFGPMIVGSSIQSNIGNQIAAPSFEHPFGTDRIGRDILLRTIAGTQLSILIAIGATAIAVILGIVLGLAPLLLGRRLGKTVTNSVEVMLAFPSLLLILFFAVVWNAGALGAMLAVGIAGAPVFARLTHNLAFSINRLDFVNAARTLGLSKTRAVLRHVLPNIGEPLIIATTTAAGGSLMVFAGLSFLGIGVQAPDDDWGRLLNEGLSRIYSNQAAALGPALMIVLAGISFNVLGEGLAVALGRESTLTMMGKRPKREARATGAPASLPDPPLLDVHNLRVTLPVGDHDIVLVDNVSFSLEAGGALGIVGESGSGKSLTVSAIVGLLDQPLQLSADRLTFDNIDLTQRHSGGDAHRLGTELAVVFQDPMTALNPRLKVGGQMTEATETHLGVSRSDAMTRAVKLLNTMGINDAERVVTQYAHELSGGMKQRVTIATCLMGPVRLLLADEPTTALDVTVQSQVLDELRAARALTGASLLLISHDMGVVSSLCDRILVMYSGRVVEDTTAIELQKGGRHPYTRGLMGSIVTMSTEPRSTLPTIAGTPPLPHERPAGCAFAQRCPRKLERCVTDNPVLTPDAEGISVACWNPEPGINHMEASSHE